MTMGSTKANSISKRFNKASGACSTTRIQIVKAISMKDSNPMVRRMVLEGLSIQVANIISACGRQEKGMAMENKLIVMVRLRRASL